MRFKVISKTILFSYTLICALLSISLILALHVVGVPVGNANEVGISGAESGGLSKDNEEVELLGLLGVDVVAGVAHSGVDGVRLVDPDVVGNDPNAGEGSGDDSELACNEELSSGGLSVLGEEHNEEAGSDDQRNVEEEQNNWVVPVNVLVEDQEVVHGDQVDGEENGENTDGDHTALDWEASAAGGADGVLVGANAKAAAAWGGNVLLWNGFLSLVGFLSSAGLFVLHLLLHIAHTGVHHGLFFFHIALFFMIIILFLQLVKI